MAIPGSWQGCPNFRKFLYHEQITVTGRPHILTGHAIRQCRPPGHTCARRSGGDEHRCITVLPKRAAGKRTDPDELFVQGPAQSRAKLICRGCPVRTECLADALDNGIEFGVWGGMTERERRAL